MSIFPKTKTTTSTGAFNALFGADGATRVNPFTTKKMVQDKVPYRLIAFHVTQTGTSAPSITYQSVPNNANKLIVAASCPCQDPCSSICIDANNCNCLTASYVSAGVYNFTFATVPTNGFDVFMGSPPEGYQAFGVQYPTTKSFQMKVWSAPSGGVTAAYVDGVLNNTSVVITIWD